ncbi:flavoprotein [Stackebrandtia nassauensis]|uniref:Phosphopantothenoylcysteine decarboxylase n=1 Tax=Stackebrandtia nassauensis (strain DSM 44728 / CIP 108903 / NRRL B-16338 / NBRC 102104 / LLR-40K-21) TaxID=446470 RepID=D3Q7H9_STANL|nr:flavoprotein [Stackebrandtia nassauensis]ADD44321.1 Phosphopantothenoylcysteine decarboxylase [Stackebrandtia nassauensis DSM 44728]
MYSSLPCKRLLVGIAGSIHAVHVPEYLLRFKREFATEIQVIMTRSAGNMVNPQVLEVYTDGDVVDDMWGNATLKAPHIRLTRWAELFLVLPATANIIGKTANGIADDLLSTAILASPHPVVFAPGMNPAMYDTPAVKRNLATLEADGHYVIHPEELTSVTSGEYDTGYGPTTDLVLKHLWHVHMRRVKEGYWDEATAAEPESPSITGADTGVGTNLKSLPLTPVNGAAKPAG